MSRRRRGASSSAAAPRAVAKRTYRHLYSILVVIGLTFPANEATLSVGVLVGLFLWTAHRFARFLLESRDAT